MLAESGGLGVDQAAIPVQVGGRVRIGAEWCTVLRLNRKDGQLVSVTTNRRYGRVVGIEAIAEVQAPDPDVVTAVKASQTKAPLCNYPGEGFVTMTKAEWERTYRDYKGTREIAQTLTHGAHRVRSIVRGYKGLDYVYVSDLPRKDAPVAAHPIKPDEDEGEGDDPCPACGRERRGGPCGCGGDVVPPPEPALDIRGEAARLQASNDRREAARAEAAPFEALRQAAKTGVQVVAAPQLFPTPAPLAERMIDALGIEKGHRILEPSAGTGNLVWEIARRWSLETDISLIAVEMNPTLADRLERTFPDVWVQAVDFLQVAPRDPEMIGPRDTAPVDRIVMNPPFAGAQDIRHIRHAYEFLKPGGRLVALCADGPRQRDVLKPWAEGQGGTYDSLPEGTFSAQGTQVRVALLVVDHD
jgi:phospholipid N-methyltransferase